MAGPNGLPDFVTVADPSNPNLPTITCKLTKYQSGVYDYECANCGKPLRICATPPISGVLNGSCPTCGWDVEMIWWTLNAQQARTATGSSFQQQFTYHNQRVATPTGAQKMPSPNTNARVWWDSQINAYRMTVPYNASFNELFKTLIPHSDRVWSADSKSWTFIEKYYEPVRALIEKTFGVPHTISKAQTQKASMAEIKTAPLEKVMLEFLKVLPYEAAHKAYRHAALLLHPDRGGDMDKMSTLNACWQRLEEEHFKKS